LGAATPELAILALNGRETDTLDLVGVLSEIQDATSLSALAELARHENLAVRNAARKAGSAVLESQILPERAAHRVVELAFGSTPEPTVAENTEPFDSSKVSAAQLWNVSLQNFDTHRRELSGKRMEAALNDASLGGSQHLLALAPQSLSIEQEGAVAAELAARAERYFANGNPLVAAQLARKASSLARNSELAKRLKDRAYGILHASGSVFAPLDPKTVKLKAEHHLGWSRSAVIGALGATFLIGLRRRRRPGLPPKKV
jgi:hypothetical protein